MIACREEFLLAMIDDEREGEEVHSFIQSELKWGDEVAPSEETVGFAEQPHQLALTPKQQAEADMERAKNENKKQQIMNYHRIINKRDRMINDLCSENNKLKFALKEKEKKVSLWENRAHSVRDKLQEKEKEKVLLQNELDKIKRAQAIASRVLGISNPPSTSSTSSKPAERRPSSSSDYRRSKEPPKTLRTKEGFPVKYDDSEVCANCFGEGHQWQGCPRPQLKANFCRVCRRQLTTTKDCKERHSRDKILEAEEKELRFYENKKRQ